MNNLTLFLLLTSFMFLERQALAQSCPLSQEYAINGSTSIPDDGTESGYLVIDGDSVMDCQTYMMSCDYTLNINRQWMGGTFPCTVANSYNGDGLGTCSGGSS